MIQSGHNYRNLKNYEFVQHDYEMTPVKPTLDAEPGMKTMPWTLNRRTVTSMTPTYGRLPIGECLPGVWAWPMATTVCGG